MPHTSCSSSSCSSSSCAHCRVHNLTVDNVLNVNHKVEIDAHNVAGDALHILNTETQSSGNLVHITGTTGQTALNVEAGAVHVGDSLVADGPRILGDMAAIANTGNVDVSKPCTTISTSGASTCTLPDGVEGQLLIMTMIADGGDMVCTVTNGVMSTITFDAVGDSCTLLFVNGKWAAVSNNWCTFA